MKIAVLASGSLGYEAIQFILENYGLDCIFTDYRSDKIIEFAKSRNLPLFLGNPRMGKADDFIKDKNVDILLSINYIFLIEKNLIDWPDKYAINFHGSLLPKYRGRTPHVWAIINNEKETGITAHLIDSGCDTGAVIEQIKIPIRNYHTGADLLRIYHTKYPELIKKVLEQIRLDKIKTVPQDNSLASYFGKRTPEDGHIDWSWTKEKIHNWVRAQAHPYPGAFSFYKKTKVFIHKIRYSSIGMNTQFKNGVLLETEPHPVVKTSNGNVELIDYLVEGNQKLIKGEHLT